MVGNDAYYTLVAFKEMCLKQPKEVKTSETKYSVPFLIRDIIPEDLIVTESKHTPQAQPKTDVKMDLTEFLAGSKKVKVTAETQEHERPVKNSKQGKRRYFTKAPLEDGDAALLVLRCGSYTGQQPNGRNHMSTVEVISRKDPPVTAAQGTVCDGKYITGMSAEGCGVKEIEDEKSVEMEIGAASKDEETYLIDLG